MVFINESRPPPSPRFPRCGCDNLSRSFDFLLFSVCVDLENLPSLIAFDSSSCHLWWSRYVLNLSINSNKNTAGRRDCAISYSIHIVLLFFALYACACVNGMQLLRADSIDSTKYNFQIYQINRRNEINTKIKSHVVLFCMHFWFPSLFGIVSIAADSQSAKSVYTLIFELHFGKFCSFYAFCSCSSIGRYCCNDFAVIATFATNRTFNRCQLTPTSTRWHHFNCFTA